MGVAWFPTDPDTGDESLIGTLHFVFAALFFFTLIYFSMFLFTKTDPARTPTRRKLQRNKIYRACGYVMALCILLLATYTTLLPEAPKSIIREFKPVFWLEATAVVAFGISWLTKGEAILWDEKAPPRG